VSTAIPEQVFFGGLEGASGEYCLPPCHLRAMRELLMRNFRPRGIPRILKAGLDPLALEQAGWGVVWPEDVSDAVRKALAPLLDWRRQRAGALFRELEYFSGEALFDFFERYDAGPDSVDPRKVPFYLLVVGGPDVLPFDLQVELAVSRAVGRITFETPEGYADYVERLLGYERGRHVPSSPTLAFFGVENQDDRLTRMAVEDFIRPLTQMAAKRRRRWNLESLLCEDATKEGLKELLVGDRTPSVILTASHAVRFRPDNPRQATHQGALVCADWPGPQQWKGRGPMIDRHLFAAADIPANADLSGLIALLFACYSAGTPRLDGYANADPGPLADIPFVSPLPCALLRRGALAVIGHVDLAFEHSFLWYRAGPQLEVFDSILYELREGVPVGFAMRHFGHRHAQLAAHVAGAVRRASQRGDADLIRDLHLWTAYVDARNYVLLGDPAARPNIGAQ
jgi:hypothetical protein